MVDPSIHEKASSSRLESKESDSCTPSDSQLRILKARQDFLRNRKSKRRRSRLRKLWDRCWEKVMGSRSIMSGLKPSSSRIEARILMGIAGIIGCGICLSWSQNASEESREIMREKPITSPTTFKSNSVIIGSSATENGKFPNPFSPPSVIPFPSIIAAHAEETLKPPQNVPHYRDAWNGFLTQEQNIFYTYQDFYTDAQYGADFGYYSKGRILQGEYFNSYTTYPMGKMKVRW
jgi:hypothetical protein